MRRLMLMCVALAAGASGGFASSVAAETSGATKVACCAMPDCEHGGKSEVRAATPPAAVAEGSPIAQVRVSEEPQRVWVAPEMRLGFLKGTRGAVPGMSEDFLAVGKGPVMGFDVEVSPGVSFCCKFGLLLAGPGGEEGEGADFDGGNMYASLGLTFRIRGASRREGTRDGGTDNQERYQ